MRLEITRRTDLALKALHALDRGKQRGADLARLVGGTPKFIPQVMSPLVRAGWVESDPGPSGGYRLARPLESISLLQLIETIEGPTANGKCVLRGSPCPTTETCAVHEAWTRARDALLAELDRTDLADVSPPLEVLP